MSSIKNLQQDLCYTFTDVSLLKRALTHRSYGKPNYERLEFVGDGILDYAIALALYNMYPALAEGELSKIRAGLVNQDSLVDLALQLKLGQYLFLGDGEVKSGGRQRPSILADTLEAIFAAISLDANIEESLRVIQTIFTTKLKDAEKLIKSDSKSLLQEYLQANRFEVPIYNVVNSIGPDHDSIFNVECCIVELNIKVIGSGKSKKEASQMAADKVFKLIKERKK